MISKVHIVDFVNSMESNSGIPKIVLWLVTMGIANDTMAPFLDNHYTIVNRYNKGLRPRDSIQSISLAKAVYYNFIIKNNLLRLRGDGIVWKPNSVIFIRSTNVEHRNMDKIFNMITDKDFVYVDALNKPFTNLSEKPNQYIRITRGIIKSARRVHNKYILFRKSMKDQKLFPYLRHIFDFYMSQEMLTIYLSYYEEYKTLIREYNPSLFVVDENTDIRTRAMTLAALNSGIKVLHIYHGVDFENQKMSYFSNVKKSVPYEFQREKLQLLGYKRKDIYVTGPVFFNYSKRPNTNKGYNLFVTTSIIEDGITSPEQYEATLRDIFSELKNRGLGKDMVIKMHPRENRKEFYERIASECGIDAKVTSSTNLLRLIKDSNITIGYGSAALLEASMYGKPIMFMPQMYDKFNLSKGNYLFDQIRIAAGLRVYVEHLVVKDDKAIMRNVKLINKLKRKI